MTKLEFKQLNPKLPNESQPKYDLGIEVTIKDLLNQLDHHGERSNLPSAIEQVLEKKESLLSAITGDVFTIATVRPDSDSVGSMAVIKSMVEGKDENIDKNLVAIIGRLDRLGVAGLSPEDKTEENQKLTNAIGYITGDRNLSLDQKVQKVQEILEGEYDKEYVEKLWSQKQKDYLEAKNNSKVTEVIPGKLVTVESSHRMATSLGYEKAPVLVAMNEKMPMTVDGKTVTYKKFTVAKETEFIPTNIKLIEKELQELEQKSGGTGTRGGTNTIIGSPQGIDSKLNLEQVVEVVKKYL